MLKKEIKLFAKELEIPYLLHFTQAKNLPTIMEYGLYPLDRIHQKGIVPRINDQYRLDGHENSISVSVSFPNSKMLYKYRCESNDIEWVIICLKASVLWKKKSAFCRYNAADSRISTQEIEKLMTLQAFKGMFEEMEDGPKRKEANLKSFDPTDVQAEVLVFDIIEPDYIFALVFESADIKNRYKSYIGDQKTYVHHNNKGLFSCRDYARKYG